MALSSSKSSPGAGAATRYRLILLFGSVFLALSLMTRIGLLVYEGEHALQEPGVLLEILATGLVYDLGALVWFCLPFALAALAFPGGARGRKAHAVFATGLFSVLVTALLFQAVAEGLFWNEFQSRFNFIAVDYLVYTHEVVGNIEQSYPIGSMLAGLGAVTFVVLALFIRPAWRLAIAPAPNLGRRLVLTAVFLILPAAVYFGLGDGLQRRLGEPAGRELAGNGTYSLFHAFLNNRLSYPENYAVLPDTEVNATLAREWVEDGAATQPPLVDQFPLRAVKRAGAPHRKNVVLITVESLGADYVGAFGGKLGLTPNLDRIAKNSLRFDNLYATGLRTVRGLEAVSVSIPPTPGRAVPVRTRNKNLDTLGSVLEGAGYDALYLYGGYSYFDNMKDFFEGSGYRVIDRLAIPDDQISHETIWGVADEDLFSLVLKTMDARAGRAKPVFAHVMTTSNHRPYTYPEGRIDIPSHSGRDGAVKYTDYALGKFLSDAAQRPWFRDTMFVILADHTSHGRGRIDLPPENYRIPMLIYAPGFVKPGDVRWVASQIDVAPTVLGLLNLSYTSHFFGHDILRQGEGHQRAFMANYLTVGYMEDGLIVELAPKRRVRVVRADDGTVLSPDDPKGKELTEEAISQYEAASAYLDATARP